MNRMTLVQRSMLPAQAHRPAADPSPLVRTALAQPGTPLVTRTRAFLEPRFGRDFSRVRLHTDQPAAVGARALGARAFTIGDHIFWGAGEHAPSARGGMHVLAHELAHVMQQGSGAATARPGPGGLQVSEPGDRFERDAHATAAAVMSHPGRGLPALAARPAGPPSIQRFLAGEAGHGGGEEAALQEAGFSAEEAHETYYGNWLRDYSQLLDTNSPSRGAVLELVRTLAAGEFGREPSEADLGKYLPSEHVDQRQGGKSAENPDLDAGTRAARRAVLSPAQRDWLDTEQSGAFQQRIKAASAASGLPEYIERAKEHAKRQIGEAATLGRNPRGFEALGNGLHAVEDYFAHSNFVEVALAQLRSDGLLAAGDPSLAATQHYVGVDPAHVGTDQLGRPQIVTGTAAPGGNDTVGMWEALKTELRNAEVRKAFLVGATIRWGRKLPEKALGGVGSVIGGAVGGVAGAVGGLLAGAGRGAAAGWQGAHGWQKPFAVIGGLFSGAATGLVHGAADTAKAGWDLGGRVGGALGGSVGRVAATPVVAAVMFSLMTLVGLLAIPVFPVVEAVAPGKMKQGTRESIAEHGTKGVALPTHSQIAKDDPDQPLHNAALRLAQVADREIGRAMIAVWAGQRPVTTAQDLVDVYLAHPQAGGWWKAELLAAVKPGASGSGS